MKLNIPSDGYKIVLNQLEKQGDRVLMAISYSNKYGHRIVQTKENKRYYIIFKKEMYKTFGDEFETNEGFGESINKEFLENSLRKLCDMILYVYDNGLIYAISPRLVKRIGKVRLQNNGTETTYSFPAKFLIRWDI